MHPRRNQRQEQQNPPNGSGPGGTHNASGSNELPFKRASIQSLCEQTDDEVGQLDNDYRDVFLRRLTNEMQAEGIATNDLRRRFGLCKETLDRLLPEYKLLLHRFDLNLYSYCQEVLTARYMHSKRIGSDTVLESSISTHQLIEVDAAAAETARKAHRERWQTVRQQRLHKASRSKLDDVMELIRTEDRPVAAFPTDSDATDASASSEAADGRTANSADAAAANSAEANRNAFEKS